MKAVLERSVLQASDSSKTGNIVILKELDPFSGEDKLQVAGRKAEEQMAHYLRRFFGKSTEVDVLN